ncbi:MAG: DedA family protein, partial [Verrucomicrobiota bacterium]
LACIAAGMLASKSAITLIWAIVASFLGIFIGDVGLFLLGKMGGIALLRRRPIRWFVKESQIHLAEKLFQEHGGKIIFSSRLLPGSRLPIYAAAGVVGYPILKFAFFMAVAGLLSAIVLVLVSYELGEIVFGWLEIYESFALPVFIAVLLLVWLTVKLMEIFATRRSRLVFLLRSRRNYQRVLSFFNRS